MDFPPSADEVAVAFIAAAKETGAHPLDLDPARRPATADARNAVSRARSYAGMALRAKCRCGPVTIARIIGAGSPDAFLSTLSNRITKGDCPWWSDSAFDRVCQEIDAFRTRNPTPAVATALEPMPRPVSAPAPPRPQPPPAPLYRPARPAAGPGKRKLEDMLRDAVLTTRAMTPKEEE